MDDAKLIGQAARGDAEAFGALFNRYAQDVYRLAQSMGHRGGEAEDLMQDTFLAAFESIGRFERRSSFKTWLFAILFRQSSKQRRYQGLRKMEPLEAASAPSGRNGCGHDAVHLDHARRMDAQTMLNTLTPDHRAVLVLREIQGLSYDEIAETLSIPRGTVESRLFRARSILRERFQEYGPSPAAPRATTDRKPVESRHA